MKSLFLALVFTLAAGSAAAQSLATVTATFDTTDNDKDHDTYLDVQLVTNRGKVLAEKMGIGGHWNNNSSNTVTLDVKNDIDKKDLKAAIVRLTIHPNGNDKWAFNYHVQIAWTDQTTSDGAWNGKTLTQDSASTSDSFAP